MPILGFDARRSVTSCIPWDEKRRKTFLLREEVGTPFSADSLVWPAIFHYGGWPNSGSITRESIGLSTDRPNRREFIQDELWTDLSALQDELQEKGYQASQYELIVLRSAAEFERRETDGAGFRSETLGYDIIDPGGLSALMNFGYNSPEKIELAAQFGADLNEFHLFNDRSQAWKFAEARSELLRPTEPHHLPLSVVELCRVVA